MKHLPKLTGAAVLALTASHSAADIIEKFVPFADSNADFIQSFPAEGIPDANGWNYGYYDHTADLGGGVAGDPSLYGVGDFTQFTAGQTRETGFGLAPSGDPWTAVGVNNGGHPEGSPSEIWSIRRYTVEAGSPANTELRWDLRAQNLGGSGTTMNIFRNGALLDTGTTAIASGVQGSYSFTDLTPGDVIDFALTPEGTGGALDRGDGSDGSFFGGTLGNTYTFNTMSIVGDSRAEFGGVQGANDWTYGMYDGFDIGNPDSVLIVGDTMGASFQPFLGGDGAGAWDGSTQLWTGSQWDANTANAQPWTFLNATDGHPNGTNQGDGSLEQWATKRWTVPSGEAGDLLVEFDLAKANNGGGTTLFVIHNGEVVGKIDSNSSVLEEGFVQIDGAVEGDTIDLALSPLFGNDTTDGGDASQFGATIHLLEPIPEPSTSLLAGLASLALLRRRRS